VWVSASPDKTVELAGRFPVGAAITLEELDKDPYPAYRRLREQEPVSWIPALGMYFVTRYEDVQSVLRDTENYVVGTEGSTLMDTFGEHMLTSEGEKHDQYKNPLLPSFRPGAVRESMEADIRQHVDSLIDGFVADGKVELRAAFARRLPVLTILSLFGLPAEDEPLVRRWYDSFEKALANFTWDEEVRAASQHASAQFHAWLQAHLETKRSQGDGKLLSHLLAIETPRPLSDEEIRRNASIIFFGGISTVEALILNTLYALHEHPDVAQRIPAEPQLLPKVLNEVMRWLSPVQSATRHVVNDTELGGVQFRVGDTVNCMLGAANHDPAMFPDPQRFDPDRNNLQRHFGFALGTHHCLGLHLARLEAEIAITGLMRRLPGYRFDPEHPVEVRGYEFRQPHNLHLVWGA
jgi:cytochrome P450